MEAIELFNDRFGAGDDRTVDARLRAAVLYADVGRTEDAVELFGEIEEAAVSERNRSAWERLRDRLVSGG